MGKEEQQEKQRVVRRMVCVRLEEQLGVRRWSGGHRSDWKGGGDIGGIFSESSHDGAM